tara:strand:+ start:1327 stop:1653 length:327 start_codon:yes stop_codon:yes gene_type:complete
MSAIDQQFSFNMTLDGAHSIRVKDHSIFGKPFEEYGYITFEAHNIHATYPKRLTLWYDNRLDEQGQSGLTLSDIAQFGLALAQKVADIKGEQIRKAEKLLAESEASNA